jgi:hypothetical protein
MLGMKLTQFEIGFENSIVLARSFAKSEASFEAFHSDFSANLVPKNVAPRQLSVSFCKFQARLA